MTELEDAYLNPVVQLKQHIPIDLDSLTRNDQMYYKDLTKSPTVYITAYKSNLIDMRALAFACLFKNVKGYFLTKPWFYYEAD